MIRRPPRSTRTDTLVPYTTLFRSAYQRYQIMIGDDYGVRWMTNYQLSSSPPSASRTDRLIAGMLPESKLLPPGTYGFNSPYVSRFTGMMIEPPRLLRALLRDIRLDRKSTRLNSSP